MVIKITKNSWNLKFRACVLVSNSLAFLHAGGTSLCTCNHARLFETRIHVQGINCPTGSNCPKSLILFYKNSSVEDFITRTMSTHEMSLMLQMALFFCPSLHCLPFLVSANKALILTAKTDTVYHFILTFHRSPFYFSFNGFSSFPLLWYKWCFTQNNLR